MLLHKFFRCPIEVLRVAVLPQAVLAELHAEFALVLAPVRPEQPAHRDINVDLDSCREVAFSVKIQIDQPVTLLPVVEAVYAKHSDIHVRILHSGVFPVGELEKLSLILGRPVEQEIVRHCVDMCQAPVLGQAFDVGAKREQILLRLAVIPVDGRIAVP